MNRIYLFLLFVVFLLVPLSVPAFSSFVPVAQIGCDAVAAITQDCHQSKSRAKDHQVLIVSAPMEKATDGVIAIPSRPITPLGLHELMQDNQAENRKQWFLLVIFAALILFAARTAPSMK